MPIVLDIAASLAIRAAIILVILQLNVSLNQTLTYKTATANIRENLATTVTIMETDLRQAGYGISTSIFLTSNASDVKFRADLQNDGTIDTVRFYLSGSEIYRAKNSETPVRIALGVTQLAFTYYTSTGATTTTASAVKSVKGAISMEENFTITGMGDGETRRPSASSEFQVYPENL